MLDILFWGFLGYTMIILLLLCVVANFVVKVTMLIFKIVLYKLKEKRYGKS